MLIVVAIILLQVCATCKKAEGFVKTEFLCVCVQIENYHVHLISRIFVFQFRAV